VEAVILGESSCRRRNLPSSEKYADQLAANQSCRQERSQSSSQALPLEFTIFEQHISVGAGIQVFLPSVAALPGIGPLTILKWG